MGSNNQKAVKTMAEEIAKALKNYIDTNNQKYVNKQINSAISTAGSIGGHGGGVMPGTINASQVRGLYNTVAGYIINAASASAHGDEIAGQIINTLGGIAAIEVQHATIDTAQIRNLYSSYGEFIELVAQHATIQGVDVEEIHADIADIGMTNIGQADIDFAQIKDTSIGTAIIREGTGGKLFIDRLAVSDANIVSLTVGELMIKDDNGKLARVYVDSEGEIHTEPASFDGTDMLNNSSVSGGKLIENTITARELNVSQIFADSALIGAIKTANLDVTDIFTAGNAFISQLYTYVISSPVGSNIDISNNASITLTNDRINLLVTSDSTSSHITLTPQMIQAVGDQIVIDGTNIDLRANQSITSLVSTTNTIQATVNNLDRDVDNLTETVGGFDDRIDAAEASVTQMETSITQMSGEIALKASQSDLNDLDDRVDDVVTDVASVTLTANGLSTVVYDQDTGLSATYQNASKINWIVSGDSISEMEFTDDALSLVVDTINLNASTIDLSRNNTILMPTGDDNDGLRRVLRLNDDGLHVGDNQTNQELLLTSDSLNVVVNGVRYSRFAANHAQFGNYQLRRTSDGGLAFVIVEPDPEPTPPEPEPEPEPVEEPEVAG